MTDKEEKDQKQADEPKSEKIDEKVEKKEDVKDKTPEPK